MENACRWRAASRSTDARRPATGLPGVPMTRAAPYIASSIAVDANGYAYVTGGTTSRDFPTTVGAFQPTFGGGSSDAFVLKLKRDGSGLVYSTYLGGEDSD